MEAYLLEFDNANIESILVFMLYKQINKCIFAFD